ncbi:MAG: ureidoglycolate lyase [Rhodospirillales bacterium]
MTRDIFVQPLAAGAFAPFGDVIGISGEPDFIINRGMCGRYHDLAAPEVGEGRAGISLFKSEARSFPYQLDMMERHPLGSQAFIPMTRDAFLVIVAPDDNGRPGQPVAFMTQPGQGVNYARNTWHGVLTPLAEPGLFAVIDRVGEGDNLEEYEFDVPFIIRQHAAG